jgi:hypothetical protein
MANILGGTLLSGNWRWIYKVCIDRRCALGMNCGRHAGWRFPIYNLRTKNDRILDNNAPFERDFPFVIGSAQCRHITVARAQIKRLGHTLQERIFYFTQEHFRPMAYLFWVCFPGNCVIPMDCPYCVRVSARSCGSYPGSEIRSGFYVVSRIWFYGYLWLGRRRCMVYSSTLSAKTRQYRSGHIQKRSQENFAQHLDLFRGLNIRSSVCCRAWEAVGGHDPSIRSLIGPKSTLPLHLHLEAGSLTAM